MELKNDVVWRVKAKITSRDLEIRVPTSHRRTYNLSRTTCLTRATRGAHTPDDRRLESVVGTSPSWLSRFRMFFSSLPFFPCVSVHVTIEGVKMSCTKFLSV